MLYLSNNEIYTHFILIFGSFEAQRRLTYLPIFMFMVPYILVKYIFYWKSNWMYMGLYVFFIPLYFLLYMFRVLFAPFLSSTNCRVQP
jgi:hypothetical protein